ncbi:MAG: RCC1 domain-containing protein [Eubacteriales bacterium]
MFIALSFKRILVFISIFSLIITMLGENSTSEQPAEQSGNNVKIVKIAAGPDTFAAIDDNGKVYVWGNSSYPPDNLPPIIDIAIGDGHIVALDENGELHGWGESNYGEIDFNENLPKFTAIAAQGYQTTALTADGKVFKWGNVNNGSQEFVPQNMGKVTQIANGMYVTAALNSDGEVFLWGVVNEAPPYCMNPVIIAPLAYSTAILGKDGKVYGDVRHIDPMHEYKAKPVLGRTVKLFSGSNTLAAINYMGRLSIWGEYKYFTNGQCFVNPPTNLPKIDMVAFGYDAVICLGQDGKVYQWGEDNIKIPREINGFLDNPPVFENLHNEAPYQSKIDVTTSAEFENALKNNVANITIKKDMKLSKNSYYIGNYTTIIVEKGVRLNIESLNFVVEGFLINRGIVSVSGRILFQDELSRFGDIEPIDNGEIAYYCGYVYLAEIERLFSTDSVFTSIVITPGNECKIIIDRDYTLPENKHIWMNIYCTLVVKEGATLTVDGIIETYNQPILEGKVLGSVTVHE